MQHFSVVGTSLISCMLIDKPMTSVLPAVQAVGLSEERWCSHSSAYFV